MYQQLSRKYTIVMSEAAIVLMSAISAFFPQYLIVAIILYMIILFGITSYTMTRRSRPPKEELRAPIFKEEDPMKIALTDKELSKELMQQMRSTLMSFITFPLVLILFPVYTTYIGPNVESALRTILSNDIATKFLNFFIMYNFVSAVITAVRQVMSRFYKPVNILLPQRYEVYTRGVLVNNRMFIRFSDDYCYSYNPLRRFIEIVSKKNPGFKIKLYSENITRLKDKIVEKKLLEECEHHSEQRA